MILRNISHDLFRLTCFVDNRDEVLRKSEWNIIYRVAENVIHHMCECIDQLVAASNQSLLLVLLLLGLGLLLASAAGTDELVEGD